MLPKNVNFFHIYSEATNNLLLLNQSEITEIQRTEFSSIKQGSHLLTDQLYHYFTVPITA